MPTGSRSRRPTFHPKRQLSTNTKCIGGLILRRDWGERGPWPTWPKPDQPDFTHLSRKVKEVIRAAGLRDELSFTSFRHGGITETGDAELTDREIVAQSRHKSVKVL